MKIELTKQDTPSRPILIESDFVAKTTPLRKTLPSQNSQTPGAVSLVWTGTRLDFADGSHVNVLEDYQLVKDLFAGPVPLALDLDALLPTEAQLDAIHAQSREAGFVKAEGTIEIPNEATDESSAGTPLTEDELQAVAEHDAIPDDERSPQPSELSPAEKRKATLEAKKAAQG